MEIPKSNVVLVAAMAIALTLGCCAGCKEPHDPSASTPNPATAAIEKPFIAFEGVQNDTGGYDGFPWGTTVADFDKLATERNKAFEEESFDSGDFLLDSATAIWYIEQVPDSGFGHGGGYDPELKYEPALATRTDMTSMAIYKFYKDKLALVSVPLDSDPTESLRSKYEFSNSIQFRSGMSATVNGTYTLDLYKRGNTNTRVYNATYSEDSGRTQHMLIYVPSAVLYEIGAQISADVEADRAEQSRQAQAVQTTQQKIESHKIQ